MRVFYLSGQYSPRKWYSLWGTGQSEQHNLEIKELQRQVKELTAALQQVAMQMQRDRDKAEFVSQLADKDRELLLSRLETKLLRYERGLPPPDGTS